MYTDKRVHTFGSLFHFTLNNLLNIVGRSLGQKEKCTKKVICNLKYSNILRNLTRVTLTAGPESFFQNEDIFFCWEGEVPSIFNFA